MDGSLIATDATAFVVCTNGAGDALPREDDVLRHSHQRTGALHAMIGTAAAHGALEGTVGGGGSMVIEGQSGNQYGVLIMLLTGKSNPLGRLEWNVPGR